MEKELAQLREQVQALDKQQSLTDNAKKAEVHSTPKRKASAEGSVKSLSRESEASSSSESCYRDSSSSDTPSRRSRSASSASRSSSRGARSQSGRDLFLLLDRRMRKTREALDMRLVVRKLLKLTSKTPHQGCLCCQNQQRRKRSLPCYLQCTLLSKSLKSTKIS